ncbi:MAG: 30S ribosomal protein S17 [Patescibacteria group bacterium]|nr:30S ribosomal protein S17 [Patescibacteria group bacterium]MDE1945828.1 30S ribosomal protein S17 [Patescibacteria group bacterium]
MKKQAAQKKTETNGKMLHGTVVSTKMKDTIVVEISSFKKHPKYGKFIKREKKIMAHDAGNTAHVGDSVEIVETRPISKNKRFAIIRK